MNRLPFYSHGRGKSHLPQYQGKERRSAPPIRPTLATAPSRPSLTKLESSRALFQGDLRASQIAGHVVVVIRLREIYRSLVNVPALSSAADANPISLSPIISDVEGIQG